jgi:cellulose 1,4-beta-cellobiosidase
MYIDAGHGGWLGWNDNLQPGAQELASAYKNAGSPSQVRGFATNVAGWNSWYAIPLLPFYSFAGVLMNVALVKGRCPG